MRIHLSNLISRIVTKKQKHDWNKLVKLKNNLFLNYNKKINIKKGAVKNFSIWKSYCNSCSFLIKNWQKLFFIFKVYQLQLQTPKPKVILCQKLVLILIKKIKI